MKVKSGLNKKEIECIEFFLPMIPPTKTHQQKRVNCKGGKPVFYEDAELKAVRQKLMANLGKYAPKTKITGAVQLLTKWCYPIQGKHFDGEYRTSKPDTDNLQKLLKDCMTACGYWEDDAQVVSEIIEKFWAKVPGIYIDIEPLDNRNPNKDMVR